MNQRFEVFVITPQIFLQSLDRGYIKMDMINLIVFDECHHCRGNHPYNLIMTLHYHNLEKTKRPLIFGMTASPQTAGGRTEAEIQQLELNLNCRTVTCQSLGLNQNINNPTERIVYYKPDGFHEMPKLYMKIATEMQKLFEYADRYIREALHFSDLLGPWCAERMLEAGLLEIKRNCRQIIRGRMLEIIENDVIANAESDLDVFIKEYWENRDNSEYFSDDDEAFADLNEQSMEMGESRLVLDSKHSILDSAESGADFLPAIEPVVIYEQSGASETGENCDQPANFKCDALATSVSDFYKVKYSTQITEESNQVIQESQLSQESKGVKTVYLEEGECTSESDSEGGYVSKPRVIDSIPLITKDSITAVLSKIETNNIGNEISFVNNNIEEPKRLKRKRVQNLMEQVVDEIKKEMATQDLEYQFKEEKKQALDKLTTKELEDIEEFIFEVQKNNEYGTNAKSPESKDISAKVQSLIDTLLEFENDPLFCGIIFCQMKSVTIALQNLLEKHPKLQFIKSAYLVGHNPSMKAKMGMGADLQASIVKKFSKGDLNLLVATRVAEEGLDIKPCNCVIQFDFLEKTVSSYIQSRGRARHLTSHYIILAEKGDLSASKLLASTLY